MACPHTTSVIGLTLGGLTGGDLGTRHGQIPHAVDELEIAPPHLRQRKRQPKPRDALDHSVQGDHHLETSEVLLYALVLAVAEGKMAFDTPPVAPDIQPVRIGEGSRIVVRRRYQPNDNVARRQPAASGLYGLDDYPREAIVND